MSKDVYKTSRVLYVIEAALEYFISIMVTGAFLAKVTTAIGLSDTLTGILTSFVSLGCGFQLIAIFLANKRPVKRWVTVLHSLNQLLFALIYLVPLVPMTATQKAAVFIVLLLLGHVLNNVVNSPKINWFMSLIEDGRRGRFTANKEMVSLIGGMVFSLAMGALIDRYEAMGNTKGAFVVCGVSVFVLMLLHSATLIFSREKESACEKTSFGRTLGTLLQDKNLFKVILVGVLWHVVNYASTPFYGSYQIKELGFSMTFVSVLSMAYAIVRTLFSRVMGTLADRSSFANMLRVCFWIMLAGFAINVFTVPENGKVLYTVYYVMNAIAAAGINSATINLIYDYVDKENRTGALALSNTLSGFAGFFTTLAVSPLVTRIQTNGNTLFGMRVYAQQVVTVISCVLLLGLIVYLRVVVDKLKNKRSSS